MLHSVDCICDQGIDYNKAKHIGNFLEQSHLPLN